MQPWPQLLYPLHSPALSALVAAVPLILLLILMGVFRKGSLFASVCGLVSTGVLAVLVWQMPFSLALRSAGLGSVEAIVNIMWIPFNALWLYNLSVDTGTFEQLRRWIGKHASGDPCIQAILVAFSFGALLEASAGFGSPVAITAFLLVSLGFNPLRAVVVGLIANTAPVAFGGLGTPIVVLGKVTGLDVSQLSAMVGRQLPLLSFLLPAYLAWVVGGGKGLRRAWPAALVAGTSFGFAQFLVSNVWGPYATDVVASLSSIGALVGFLRIWTPRSNQKLPLAPEPPILGPVADHKHSPRSSDSPFAGWLPWAMLSLVMVSWSCLKLFDLGVVKIPVPALHHGFWITAYQKTGEALYEFKPLGPGTAVFVATMLTALWFGVRPPVVLGSAVKTLRQLWLSALTVVVILSLAKVYNYSGMVYTLGKALARVGPIFPVVSSFLGWIACFLTGSDLTCNVLFGNLQVAVAAELQLSPILLAATNSSGGVTGKMISPQNLAVGVTTVGLVGQEGKVLRCTFPHSVLLAALVGLLAFIQAYCLPWMVP